ncbi:MAG: hydrogenase [Methanospirillaceae archaeon]|nr:hydrogenase [Methanospirillaceae archaeon]
MNGIETLTTGFGFWNPIFWVAGFVIALIITWIIWRRGEATYNTSPSSTGPFLSGNAEPQPGEIHVPGGNLYWGFTQALERYYAVIKPLHTGNLADYMLWYMGITAIMLILVVMVP